MNRIAVRTDKETIVTLGEQVLSLDLQVPLHEALWETARQYDQLTEDIAAYATEMARAFQRYAETVERTGFAPSSPSRNSASATLEEKIAKREQLNEQLGTLKHFALKG